MTDELQMREVMLMRLEQESRAAALQAARDAVIEAAREWLVSDKVSVIADERLARAIRALDALEKENVT
jgi:hypothetical protein